MLDDPTSSLDVKVTRSIMEGIKNSEWRQKTYVITTNKLKMLEYADKVVYMEKGSMSFNGSVEEFKQSSMYENLQEIFKKSTEEQVSLG